MPELAPGERIAVDPVTLEPLAFPLQPLTASVGGLASPPAHWKDEGHLTLYTGEVMIISGAGPGWEDKLGELGVKAVRLDGEHIAVKVPG